MRLFLAIPSLRCGGSERVMSILATHWAEQGNEVTLATFDPPETDFFAVSPAVRRVVIGSAPSRARWLQGNLARVRALRSAVRQAPPNVVVSFLYTTNLFGLLAARGLAPVVVAERTDPRYSHVERSQAALRRLLYPRAAALVVQTERVLEGWARKLVSPARAYAIPNPVLPPMDGSWNGPLLPERFVASVGSLIEDKGFDVLIEAFARAAPELPGWSLVILGEGPLRPRLEAQVKRLGLGNRVLLPGIGDAGALFARAHAYAAASRFEGFPNALLEAMAHGLPVISTDCPSGPAEIVREGVDGFLVPVGDVEALAACMLDLCRDESRRAHLGRRAREVLERFDLERVAAQWESLFRSIA
jgi:glycosyltransferase involved in cell wall biosynthesis